VRHPVLSLDGSSPSPIIKGLSEVRDLSENIPRSKGNSIYFPIPRLAKHFTYFRYCRTETEALVTGPFIENENNRHVLRAGTGRAGD
jgi:hypothetical protein